MKQWIREHPWRLEIVPAISVAFAAVVPLIYRSQIALRVKPKHGLSPSVTWWGNYIVGIIFMLICLLGHIYCTHLTAKIGVDSNDKKFPLAAIISCAGLTVTLYLVFPLLLGWVFICGVVLILSAWLIQPRLVRNLPESPLRDVPQPDLSDLPKPKLDSRMETPAPGEPFYYKNNVRIKIPRRFSLHANLAWIILIAVIVSAFLWDCKGVWDVIIVVILLAFLFIPRSAGPYFKVTPEKISVRTLDEVKINIQMADIVRCEVVDAYISPDEHFMMSFDAERPENSTVIDQRLLNIGRRLEIETNGGIIHKFRLNNPYETCKLINTAIAARQKPEGEA
ncbi:MAG: hypothetical protein ABFD64_10585 [Armatimonadota bacterium]